MRGKRQKLVRIASLRKPDEREEGQLNIPCRSFYSLPQVLVIDILSRLCFKTVGICRCVCKEWLSITSGSNFARLHYSKSVDNPGYLFQYNSSTHHRNHRCITYLTEERARSHKYVELSFEHMSRINMFPGDNSVSALFRLINSCNGFIFLEGASITDGSWTFFVCNPVTGEYIHIPKPEEKMNRCSYEFEGLGFSPVTNEYKVLRTSIRHVYKTNPKAEIYTIGSRGVWRRTIGKPPVAEHVKSPRNSYLHGALHWYLPLAKSIHSFDFEKEEFRQLPMPNNIVVHSMKESNDWNDPWALEVLQGRLFLSVILDRGSRVQCDLWVMKDYGAQESWTKVFVIQNLYQINPSDHLCLSEPFMFLSDGNILLSFCNSGLIYYNQETESCLEIRESWNEIIGYHPSFVSLRSVSNGARVERIRDSIMYDKLCAQSA